MPMPRPMGGGMPYVPGLGAQTSATNPYASGISVPGTGANNSAMNYKSVYDPTTGGYGAQMLTDQAIAPYFTAGNEAQVAKSLTGTNETLSGGPGGYNLNVNNKGGGQTNVGYTLDPTTGYYKPSSAQGVGQSSWWQSTGLPMVGMLAAGAGAAGAAGLFGAGAGAGAGAAATDIGTTDLGVGMGTAGAAGGAGTATGAAAGAAGAGTAATGPTLGQAWNDFNLAKTGVGLVSNLTQGGGNGMTTSSVPSAPGSYLGGNLPGTLANLYNTYQGNQANQQIGGNLMNMYNTAQGQAAPSVGAVNNTISNPQSYFSSPLYQSQASLEANNLNATNNAAGNSGNIVGMNQKMTGFAAQQYNNYLNSLNSAAQGFLGNQAKYGQDYAFGTALSNTSGAGANANYANTLASLLGNTGGLSSLFGGSANPSPWTQSSTGLNPQYDANGNLINSATSIPSGGAASAASSAPIDLNNPLNWGMNQGSGGGDLASMFAGGMSAM